MTEAREILLEDAKKTIADHSFVRALIRKWKDFLEGMPDRTDADRYTLGVTAVLMENQSQYLQNLSEDTRQANVGSFTKFIFPVLRRVFPNLIANDIVSVQPMTAPIGAVFFLDYKYGTNKGGTASGNVFPRDFDRDYSSEYINGELLATGDGVKYGGGGQALAATLAFVPVRPLDASLGYSVQVIEYNVTTGAVVQTATTTARARSPSSRRVSTRRAPSTTPPGPLPRSSSRTSPRTTTRSRPSTTTTARCRRTSRR